MNDAELYGRGVGFPLRVAADGSIAWSSGEANVRESLRIILLTGSGERLRRNDFGAGLERFVFEPNVPATWSAIEDRIKKSVERFEPRMKIERIDVGPDPEDPEAAIVTLAFTLVANGQPGRTSISVPVKGR